mgnify:CR=1 FL=1
MMRCERLSIPTSAGAEIALDVYVPAVSKEIDLEVRRPAIVICPGGGYEFLSEREAEPVALRFLKALTASWSGIASLPTAIRGLSRMWRRRWLGCAPMRRKPTPTRTVSP